MMQRYALLAQIELSCEYYLGGGVRDLALRPSLDTARRLAAAGLRYHALASGGRLLVRVDALGKPLAPLPSSALVFQLSVIDARVVTVANINLSALRADQRFHFHNRSGNALENPTGAVGERYLSRPIAAYADTQTYLPGDLVRHGARTFECLQKTSARPPASASAYWVDKGPTLQAASAADLVTFYPQRVQLTASNPASAVDVRVFALDPNTGSYSRPVGRSVWRSPDGLPTTQVPVDLTSLQPGRYRVELNGESVEGWFDSQTSSGLLGVVELHLDLPASDPLAVVDLAGSVRSVKYVIAFGNRRAYWKYLTPRGSVDAIRVVGEESGPFSAVSSDPSQPQRKDYFISDRPLGLKEWREPPDFELVIDNEPREAPRPNLSLPGSFTQRFDETSQSYLDSICTIWLDH